MKATSTCPSVCCPRQIVITSLTYSSISRVAVKTKQRNLADIEDAFYGIFANFPSKTLSLAMRGVAFPTGRCYHQPSDTLAQEVSQLISTDTQVS